MVLQKTETLYERDEKGELLPQEVSLEIGTKKTLDKYKDEKIIVTPLPRGELKKFFKEVANPDNSEIDYDGQLILEHCINPKYTDDEVKCIKPDLTAAIVDTILRESGISVKNGKKKSTKEAEDNFSKN